MVTKIRLDQAYTAILTAYYSMLDDARSGTGLLVNENVETIIRADQKRPKPKTPSIWIFPNPAMNVQKLSLKESWNLPIQLVSIVQEKDPIVGYNNAFKLSSLARSVILSNRDLGLNYVRDTISKSFEPTVPPESKHRNLHSHSATLITRFEVYE